MLVLIAPTAALASSPFEIRSHEIEGLIHQVWPLRASTCTSPASDLLVLSTVGGPPQQEKRLTFMPCGAALVPGDPRIIRRKLPDDTVVLDVAKLPGRTGPQLILVNARGLRIESLGQGDPPRTIEIPGGLPLPYRPWEISRVALVDDWDDLGRPTALVPSLHGALLVDLVSGKTRGLEFPMYAQYRTHMPHLPGTVWKWMLQEVAWPTLSRADDNGDGRIDLFALSRWAIWIFHAGPDGLPSTPSRKLEFVPFDEETERTHEATGNNYHARDIDGDGRADLLLSTVGGGMMDGRSTTRIHLNPGTGVSIDSPPAAERALEGGFSSFTFVDVDGDGREELFETSLEIGVVQIVRVLLTRRAETRIRVLALDPTAEGGTRTLYEDDFALRLDFGENSVRGLIPNLGDWNGDGQMDFYVAKGDEAIAFRMGRQNPDQPLFGSPIERQSIPLSGGESRIADLDGDGLDEIIAFNDRDPAQPLIVLENLGTLPGTAPSMNPTD